MNFVDPAHSLLSSVLATPPPRRALAVVPTPVVRAAWADTGGVEVWIKRDDQSSVLYSGGKVRKLEWVLAAPALQAAPWVVSAGATGSHHLLAMALHLQGTKQRFAAFVFPQPHTPHVQRNFAALVSLGVEIWPMRSRLELPFRWLTRALWPRGHEGWYYVDAGASSGRGCLGFVEAGLELAAQIESGDVPRPDRIFIPAGTAGSCAGLAVGLALAGVATTVVAVATVEPWAFNALLLRRKLHEVWHELRSHGLPVSLAHFDVASFLRSRGVSIERDASAAGAGYGAPTESGEVATTLATENGLELEPTYTGKAMAALRHGAQQGLARSAKVVLYWHTHSSIDLAQHVVPDWELRVAPMLRASVFGGRSGLG